MREYIKMEEGAKNSKILSVYGRFQCIYKTMLLYFLKCGKNTEYKKSRSCKDKNKRMTHAFIKMCSL